jgi:hypothetical protein
MLYGISIIAFYFNWNAAGSSQFLANLYLDLRFFVCFQTKQINV